MESNLVALFGLATVALAIGAHWVAYRHPSRLGHVRALLVWIVPLTVSGSAVMAQIDQGFGRAVMGCYYPLLLALAVSALHCIWLAVSALRSGEIGVLLVAAGGVCLGSAGVLPLWTCVPLA